MRKLLIILVISLLLSACATPYQANGLGGGYSEIQLNDDMYKVSFRGNAATSKNQVAEMLLRRCAELTKQNGYKYFLIAGSNVDVQNTTYTTPTTVDTNTIGNINGYGNLSGGYYGTYNMNYSGNYYGISSTTINPGRTYNFREYTTSAIIKMTKRRVEGSINADIYLRNYQSN